MLNIVLLINYKCIFRTATKITQTFVTNGQMVYSKFLIHFQDLTGKNRISKCVLIKKYWKSECLHHSPEF